jgi:hypothetical protein
MVCSVSIKQKALVGGAVAFAVLLQALSLLRSGRGTQVLREHERLRASARADAANNGGRGTGAPRHDSCVPLHMAESASLPVLPWLSWERRGVDSRNQSVCQPPPHIPDRCCMGSLSAGGEIYVSQGCAEIGLVRLTRARLQDFVFLRRIEVFPYRFFDPPPRPHRPGGRPRTRRPGTGRPRSCRAIQPPGTAALAAAAAATTATRAGSWSTCSGTTGP